MVVKKKGRFPKKQEKEGVVWADDEEHVGTQVEKDSLDIEAEGSDSDAEDVGNETEE